MSFIHGLHYPKTFPTNAIIKQLATLKEVAAQNPSRINPNFIPTSKNKQPRISWRTQERLRTLCAFAKIDVTEIGLPKTRGEIRPKPDEKLSLDPEADQKPIRLEILDDKSRQIIKQAER